MAGPRWALNRMAAALAGATLVGVFAAVIGLFSEPTCVSACVAGVFGCVVYWSLMFGSVPGMLALTLTPASKRPWRSLPFLVLGTLVGFMVWLFVVPRFSMENDLRSPLILFLFPTLTGLATAFNIDRFMPRPRAMM